MSTHRYTFRDSTDFASVEATLMLAIWAVEAIHGESAVKLAGPHSLDAVGRTIEVDGTSRVGRTLNRLLVGFLAKEYGNAAFRVERLRSSEAVTT